MISNKKIFSLLFLSILIFSFSNFNFALAQWQAPGASPTTQCGGANPGGCAPINVSGSNQTKAGPLGISGTLVAFSNFFANKMGIGPGFLIRATAPGTALPINPNAVLDLEGKISLRGSSNPVLGGVLTSDATGLASWQTGLWNRVSGFPNDIENGNTGIVYFKNSLARKGSTVSTNDQINLGVTSNTSAANSTIGGGRLHDIVSSAQFSVIGGGDDNNISGVGGVASTIAGGTLNDIASSGSYNTIGGGQNNDITSSSGSNTILGGQANRVTGTADSSVIPGGRDNQTASSYSFVGGRNANLGTGANGTFLWEHSATGQTALTPPSNSFLIFPRDTVNGKVAIGTTNTTANVNIGGTVKVESTASPALEVAGTIKVGQPPYTAGSVLKDVSGTGVATWQTLPVSPTPTGDSTIRISCRNGGNNCSTVGTGGAAVAAPPACSTLVGSGWTEANYNIEAVGSDTNNVRTCYRTSGVTQVFYVRSNGSNIVCPTTAGWNSVPAATSTSFYYTEAAGGGINNRVKVCYYNHS